MLTDDDASQVSSEIPSVPSQERDIHTHHLAHSGISSRK